MKYFSMFSGIGGFEEGVRRATHNRWECVGFSEIDKHAIATYHSHFPEHKNFGNATTIDPSELPDFDIICGGFPCQSFSIAGKRMGFEDTRGTLFFDIARIIKVKRPRIVFLENVKGLLNHDGGRTFATICETLNSLGYLIDFEILNSKNFGVPQNRERIFLLCHEIKGFVEDGLMKNGTLSKSIIEKYLFNLLLTNLNEVRKLQEHRSKEWLLAWLLWKEIYRSLNQSEQEKIKDGHLIPTEEKSFESTENMWQNIDSLLKYIWEENYLEQNKYTISTAIKQITDWKIYTYSKMLHSISLCIVHLRNSSKDYWKEMLSHLIVIQEDTNYARISEESEERIVTENNTAYESIGIQERTNFFVIGHSREGSSRQIFPIGKDGKASSESGNTERMEQIAQTLTARQYTNWNGNFTEDGTVKTLTAGGNSGGLHSDMTFLSVGTLRTHKDGEGFREMSEDICPTIPARAREFGSGQPVIIQTPRGNNKGGEHEISPTVSANSFEHNNHLMILSHSPRSGDPTKGGTGPLISDKHSFTLDSTPHNVIVGTNDIFALDLYNKKAHSDRTPTLTEPHHNSLRMQIGNKIRRLTPIECERLQGFPDNWTLGSDTQRYKMCGNAVTVNVIEAIIGALLKAL